MFVSLGGVGVTMVYVPDIAEGVKHLLPEGILELRVVLVSRDNEAVFVR